MRFSTKVFIAIFLSGLTGAWGVTYALSQLSIADSTDHFRSKYAELTQTLGDTLFELEGKTEQLMRASLRALDSELKRNRLLSRDELTNLANDLGVSQLYVANDTGKFIRSTKEEPETLPNIFSFCPTYEATFRNLGDFVPTGIMPGIPSGLPHKFLLGRSSDRRYVLEVGLHADYIGRTLQATAKSDPNILAIMLQAPNGQALGRFGKPGAEMVFDNAASNSGVMTFEHDIMAVHPLCCSCLKRSLTNGEYSYKLKVAVSTAPLVKAESRIQLTALIAAILVGGVCVLLASFFSGRLVSRIKRMDKFVSAVTRNGPTDERLNIDGKDEVARLGRHLDQMMNALAEKERQTQSFIQKEATIRVASQLAHDIRSPLTALSVLSSKIDTLPESSRILVRSAVSRIQDVANQLLKTSSSLSTNTPIDETETLEPLLLSSIVEALVSEKRVQYSLRQEICIESDLSQNSYGLFAYAEKSVLLRVLSNLVDNSCEAIKENGKVIVHLDESEGGARLRVTDNGPGIPSEILLRIGERGVTAKSNGHGLGLYWAKTTIERWGGEFSVSSSAQSGVEISIRLNKVPPPHWFYAQLRLSRGGTVVILDDDPSIHATWDQIFTDAKLTDAIRIVHFSDSRAAGAWIGQVRDLQGATFLVDYELLREKANGLDFIEDYSLESRAVLVTSHHETPSVLNRCLSLGVPLLPKAVVPWVPISLGQMPADDAEAFTI